MIRRNLLAKAGGIPHTDRLSPTNLEPIHHRPYGNIMESKDDSGWDTDLEIEGQLVSSFIFSLSSYSTILTSAFTGFTGLPFSHYYSLYWYPQVDVKSGVKDVFYTTEVFEGFDHSGKTSYINACQKSKVVPVSYYLRHMQDSELRLRHHQLGSTTIKPIALSLVVRQQSLVDYN